MSAASRLRARRAEWAAAETATPLATERQVAYALALNAVVGPFERYTAEQYRAMSRDEISGVIAQRQGL